MRFPVLGYVAAAAWTIAWFMSGNEPYRAVEPPVAVLTMRESFYQQVARFGGDGANLVPGLVLGDTSHVSESLTNAMRVSSLAHLTAVSGANCAVIVAVVFGLSALTGMNLAWRATFSLVALGGFVLLVGAEPSVIRAAIMATLALIALVIGRPVMGVTVLSGAVIVSLILAPTLSHSIGFALSVSATGGLLVLTSPLTRILGQWIPVSWAGLLAIPMAAQISVQPLLLILSPRISTYGIVANMLADPLAPVATIAGLVALLLGVVPWLSTPLAFVAWLASSLIVFVARAAAALPLATIPWPSGGVGILLSVVVTALTVWAIFTRQIVIAYLAGVLAVGILSTTVGAAVVSWSAAPNDWSWAQCDVGQGDAVIIRDSGHAALIDTGRDEVALRDCLSRLGIDRLDLVVLTHFDIDHVGAYAVLLGRVGTVVHGPVDGIADEELLADFRETGSQVVEVHRGDRGAIGRLDWVVLWPTPTIPTEPANPSSVVVAVTPGHECSAECLSGIDLGDLPAHEQSVMRGLGGVGRFDIVKVSHHGSRDQSPELYQQIHAPVALIGVGADNEYGHPTEFTVDLIRASGGTDVRSDVAGTALVRRSEDGVIRVWRSRPGTSDIN